MSLSLEEQERDVPDIEVNEVFRFCPSSGLKPINADQASSIQTMGDKAAKIAPNNTVPRRTFPVIELHVGGETSPRAIGTEDLTCFFMYSAMS